VGSTAPIQGQWRALQSPASKLTIGLAWVSPDGVLVAFVQGHTTRTDAGDEVVQRLAETSIAVITDEMGAPVLTVDLSGFTRSQMRGSTRQTVVPTCWVKSVMIEGSTCLSADTQNVRVELFPDPVLFLGFQHPGLHHFILGHGRRRRRLSDLLNHDFYSCRFGRRRFGRRRCTHDFDENDEGDKRGDDLGH
jgi:hypothetical protein